MQLSDFALPNTTDLEHRLLASVITSPDRLYDVMRIVKPEMFSTPENVKIWETVTGMLGLHETIDLVTVVDKVDRKYFIDNIIGADANQSYLSTLDIAMSLVDNYIKKEAYFSAVSILEKVERGIPSDEVMATFTNFQERVAGELRNDCARVSTDLANELAEDLEQGRIARVPTPFPTLNSMTYGGLGGGNLVILAARPSVGKTTIAMQLAQHSSRIGKKTAFYSLEMGGKELVQRLILGTGLVTPTEIFSHNIDWQNFDKALGMAVNDKLIINDKSRTLDEICLKITLECQRNNCDIAFIDYLGLIPQRNKRISLAQHLGECTARLKGVAKENNIPIVLLCQLNRESAKDGRSPQLYDLRDSGSIEQDADIVLMLERPRDDMGTTIENAIDMWVRKNRSGRCNFDTPIRLRGDETYSNFYETTGLYSEQ